MMMRNFSTPKNLGTPKRTTLKIKGKVPLKIWGSQGKVPLKIWVILYILLLEEDLIILIKN